MLATTPLHHFQVQILSTKIEAALLDLLQQAKEAGTKASLSFTTVGGKMEAKFEVELVSTGPATASSSPTVTTTAPGGGRCQRDRQHWLALRQEQRLTRHPWLCLFRRLRLQLRG